MSIAEKKLRIAASTNNSEQVEQLCQNGANVRLAILGHTVILIKQWKMKTTLKQFSSVFDIVMKQIVLLAVGSLKIDLLSEIAVSRVYWTIKIF